VPDIVDQYFDIVVHANSNRVRTRVKPQSDEAAARRAANLADSITASTERLYRATQPTAAERMEERKMVGMGILGGLAGLIIWRATSRLVVKAPFAVDFSPSYLFVITANECPEQGDCQRDQAKHSRYVLRPYRAGGNKH